MGRIWRSITYVLQFFTFSPTNYDGSDQVAILPSQPFPNQPGSVHELKGYPIFKPPGHRVDGPGSDFECEYPDMKGWSPCSTPENRGCWLKNDKTGKEIGIDTNYEETDSIPFGIHRTYYLNVTEGTYNADGMDFKSGKFFNNTYPGPWIQGCWGDNITVIVENQLRHNGTSVHWHGIRQWQTMHMDGVNGVTQCPIAPGDTFNYTFRAMQYGSAWYHSHYSVQYADGTLGPLTLHGPTTEPYDEAKSPLLMTDWGHNSAFNALGGTLEYPSILLNGNGSVKRYYNQNPQPLQPRDPYTIHFQDIDVKIGPGPMTRRKRFLMRLINTSFAATFVFSIDCHRLQIVGADFVPINSYKNESVLIGIGQRYNVIVEADPKCAAATPLPKDKNYWIRTWKANCFGFKQPNSDPTNKVSPGYEKTGILRYDSSSTADPTTEQWKNVSLDCSDEEYDSLKPYLKWDVPYPPAKFLEKFSIMSTSTFKGDQSMYPFAIFSMAGDNTFMPMRVDYANPTFLNLENDQPWNPEWVVIPEEYNNDTDWVYMVIKGHDVKGTIGAHPIHLHGHDFAILQQNEVDAFPKNLNLKVKNPPRRDVVLLPSGGYVVLAFKTDNPGAWLVHCHIARHAGEGLAMQIMERQKSAAQIWPFKSSEAIKRTIDGCGKWNTWWNNCTNWWAPEGQNSCDLSGVLASPDSGI